MALFRQKFIPKSTGMKILLKYGKFNFALLLCLTFLLIYITDRYILTVGFYEDSGEFLSGIPGKDIAVYETLQKWIYFSSALYLLLKLGTITLILHTALYLNDQNVPIGNIFKVSVLSEFVFLIPALIKVLTFRYTYPNGNLLDWHRYYILSLLSFFKNVPADWYYALQTVNIFEIIYWFMLGFGIAGVTGLNFDRSLRIVVISYVPALLVWIAAVTFFTLMMFPSTG